MELFRLLLVAVGLLRQLGINDRSNEKAWDEFFASLISSRVVLPEYRPPTPLDDTAYAKLLAYRPYTSAKA